MAKKQQYRIDLDAYYEWAKQKRYEAAFTFENAYVYKVGNVLGIGAQERTIEIRKVGSKDILGTIPVRFLVAIDTDAPAVEPASVTPETIETQPVMLSPVNALLRYPESGHEDECVDWSQPNEETIGQSVTIEAIEPVTSVDPIAWATPAMTRVIEGMLTEGGLAPTYLEPLEAEGMWEAKHHAPTGRNLEEAYEVAGFDASVEIRHSQIGRPYKVVTFRLPLPYLSIPKIVDETEAPPVIAPRYRIVQENRPVYVVYRVYGDRIYGDGDDYEDNQREMSEFIDRSDAVAFVNDAKNQG